MDEIITTVFAVRMSTSLKLLIQENAWKLGMNPNEYCVRTLADKCNNISVYVDDGNFLPLPENMKIRKVGRPKKVKSSQNGDVLEKSKSSKNSHSPNVNEDGLTFTELAEKVQAESIESNSPCEFIWKEKTYTVSSDTNLITLRMKGRGNGAQPSASKKPVEKKAQAKPLEPAPKENKTPSKPKAIEVESPRPDNFSKIHSDFLRHMNLNNEHRPNAPKIEETVEHFMIWVKKVHVNTYINPVWFYNEGKHSDYHKKHIDDPEKTYR